jgi:hypothetical protein
MRLCLRAPSADAGTTSSPTSWWSRGSVRSTRRPVSRRHSGDRPVSVGSSRSHSSTSSPRRTGRARGRRADPAQRIVGTTRTGSRARSASADDLSMRIWLSDSKCVDDLALAFQDAGCAAERTGTQTLAIPPQTAQADVAFFVKAWRMRHPLVRMRLITPRICPRARARRRTAWHPCVP